MLRYDCGQHFLENLQLVPYPCGLYNVTVNFTEGSGWHAPVELEWE